MSQSIDDLLTSVIKEQSGCSLARQAEEKLDEAARASLDRAMRDTKTFSISMIFEVLTQMGFEVGRELVAKHRRYLLDKPDQCICQKRN